MDPLLVIWDAQLGDPTPLGITYEVVWSGERALIVYGLVRIGELALRVGEARAELARTAVARERLRFATDLDDLLEVSGTVRPVALLAEADVLLATVLREGVTNVLRHSEADRCELDVDVVARNIRLRLVNDGVPGGATASGLGLKNLERRAWEPGGTLTAAADGDAFRPAVEVPLQPALIGRDADRVDAVPGVQLHDGRGQVVADGTPAQ